MTLGVPAAAAMLKTFFYLSRHHEILKIPLILILHAFRSQKARHISSIMFMRYAKEICRTVGFQSLAGKVRKSLL